MALKRRKRSLAPPIANVIVVEGELRELGYFEQAAKAATTAGTWRVVTSSGGDPVSILRKLVEEATGADRLFAVFDGDRLPPYCSMAEVAGWEKLLDQIRQPMSELRQVCAHVRAIKSHPCIEVWFLWHFTGTLPSPQPIQSGQSGELCSPYKKALAQRVPGFDSKPPQTWRLLEPMIPEACQVARRHRTAKPVRAIQSDVDLLLQEMGLTDPRQIRRA